MTWRTLGLLLGLASVAACNPAPAPVAPTPVASSVMDPAAAPSADEIPPRDPSGDTGAPGTTDPSPEMPAPPAWPDDPAARVAQVQKALAAVTGFTSEEIPTPARPLLTELKRSLTTLVRTTVDDLITRGHGQLAPAEVDGLGAVVEERAASAAANVLERAGERDEPGRLYVNASRSKQNPRYAVITFGYQVPCGSDTGLVVYDLGVVPNRAILTLTSPDDTDTIQPLFWELGYAVAPPGGANDLLFAMTRITPWCQSAARMLELKVVRATSDPEHPESLLDVDVPHHLLHGYSVDLTRSGVRLVTHDGMSPRTQRWSLVGGRAQPM